MPAKEPKNHGRAQSHKCIAKKTENSRKHESTEIFPSSLGRSWQRQWHCQCLFEWSKETSREVVDIG
jgi:hypothetical protein